MVSLLTFCGGQGGQAQELGKEVQGQGQGQAEGHMKAGEAEGQAQARSRLCALLPQFQAALSGLLGDVNELTQVGGGREGPAAFCMPAGTACGGAQWARRHLKKPVWAGPVWVNVRLWGSGQIFVHRCILLQLRVCMSDYVTGC